MDASRVEALRSRALRLLLGSLVAGGAAVVGGLLLGGATASADHGRAPAASTGDAGALDGLLGAVGGTVTATGQALDETLDGVGQAGSAVTAPIAQEVVQPVVQAVAPAEPVPSSSAPVPAAPLPAVPAPIAPVPAEPATAEPAPTAPVPAEPAPAAPTLTATTAPLADVLDGVLAAVPLVDALATAPVHAVLTPVTSLVDATVTGAVDAVDHAGQPVVDVLAPHIDLPGAVDLPRATDLPDAIGLPGATDVADASEASSIDDVQLGRPPLTADAPDDVATARTAAVDRGAPTRTLASPTLPVPSLEAQTVAPGDRTPQGARDAGPLGTVAAAGAAFAAIADASHDHQPVRGASVATRDHDDRLPTSVVGEHDSSPD